MIIIRTDSMKIREDFKASLEFVDDFTGEHIFVGDRIDSAGYRYRSFWVASSNLPDTLHNRRRYERQYPASPNYLWWNGQTANCLTTFLRDSLYVVGGSLSVDCVGALSPIANINNSFNISTDTLINDTTRATKLIVVDQDPADSLFIDSLGSDRIRGIAWQEYAGSSDPAHCHEGNIYNPRYNHYWDIFINSQGDTCIDTRYPCENRYGRDTGIMQIYREFDTTAVITGWERHFMGQSLPPGYIRGTWDSLTWNWASNIHNGEYIHNVYMPSKFVAEQELFLDSCSFADCDTFPGKRNKQDLKSYGYHRGDPEMRKVRTESQWSKTIADSTHNYEYSIYVQNVRKFRYRRPWEE